MEPPPDCGSAERLTRTEQVQIAREVAQRLETWFDMEGRQFPWREDHLERWQLLLTELLLQQTPAARVGGFVEGFFDRYPTLEAICDEREEQLAEALAPLGLQRRRARRIRELTLALRDKGGEVPDNRNALLGLPGVGPYIANAYLSIVHRKVVASIDVNMARVLERLFGPRRLVDIRYDPHLQATGQLIVESATDPRVMNWAILDLGARYCTARNPNCLDCPLKSCCSVG